MVRESKKNSAWVLQIFGCGMLVCLAVVAAWHKTSAAIVVKQQDITRLPDTEKTLYEYYFPMMGDSGPATPAPNSTTSTPALSLSPTPSVSAIPTLSSMPPTLPPTLQSPQSNSTATSTPSPGASSTSLPPPTPLPSPTPYFGFGVEAVNLQTAAQPLGTLGVVWTRQNSLLWSDVEANPGERHWERLSELEAGLRQAASVNLNTILIIRGTPPWAQKVAHSLCGPIKSDQFASFGQFVYEVVTRYSQPPYNVTYFEIGNEVDALNYLDPDIEFGCWAGGEDATYRGGGYYASMLKVVYPRVKAANPQAQVLLGGFLADCDPVHPPTPTSDCSYVRFFEGILKEGGADYFDGISYHSYDWYHEIPGQWSNANWNSAYNKLGPSLIEKARYYKSMLRAYNVTGKYIIDTEAALICSTCIPEMQHERAKTWYIPELFAAGMAEGLRGVLWYSYEGWYGSGLVDGNQLAPSAEAIRVAHVKFGDATYIGQIVPSDVGTVGVMGYKFKQGNRTLWLLRSYDVHERVITFKTPPTTISDPLNTPMQPSTSLTLTLKPLYIEWVAN